MLAHPVRGLARRAREAQVHARLAEMARQELRMTIGHVQQAHVAEARHVVEVGVGRERPARSHRRGGPAGIRGAPLAQNSRSSAIALMPEAAHTSSLAGPGAPDTPIAPTRAPCPSITMPPATAATPGRLRMPALAFPGCTSLSRAAVLILKLTA